MKSTIYEASKPRIMYVYGVAHPAISIEPVRLLSPQQKLLDPWDKQT